MSFFGVTDEVVESISPIPGRDFIKVVKLRGLSFSVVVNVSQGVTVGAVVKYVPVDAILPQPLIESLGLVGRLAGKEKNRVKTIQLGGVYSQGLIGPVGVDYSSVTKYEPEPVYTDSGVITRSPEGVSKYDIEGCERNPEILEMLQEVVVTEKLEGTNWWGGIDESGVIRCGLHSGQIQHDADNRYWAAGVRGGIFDKIRLIQADRFPGMSVYLRGEMCGPKVQGNIYALASVRVYAFDLLVNGQYLSSVDFFDICEKYDIETVPVLFVGGLDNYLAGQSVGDKSNGMSVLGDVMREGIVIKPLHEKRVYGFGRVILKQRSPKYLAEEV